MCTAMKNKSCLVYLFQAHPNYIDELFVHFHTLLHSIDIERCHLGLMSKMKNYQ